MSASLMFVITFTFPLFSDCCFGVTFSMLFNFSSSRLCDVVVQRSIRGNKVGVSILGRVNSRTEELTPVASLVSVHHLTARSGLVGPVSV